MYNPTLDTESRSAGGPSPLPPSPISNTSSTPGGQKPVPVVPGSEKYPPIGAGAGAGYGGPGGAGSGSGSIFGSGPSLTGSTTAGATRLPDSGIGDMLAGSLKGMLGGETRYTPGVVERMKGGLLSATRGQEQTNARAIEEDAVRRGMYRSGQTGKRLDEARRAGAQQYTEGVNKIQTDKVNADFTDKLAGMDRAQKYLDSLRDYSLRSDLTAIEREKLAASTALGYANLAMEKERLSSQMELAYSQLGWDREKLNTTLAANWDITNLERTTAPKDMVTINTPNGPVTVPWNVAMLMYQGGG